MGWDQGNTAKPDCQLTAAQPMKRRRVAGAGDAVDALVPLRSERDALRSERDALRSERDALRSALELLQARRSRAA